jgi:hypothetical protein
LKEALKKIREAIDSSLETRAAPNVPDGSAIVKRRSRSDVQARRISRMAIPFDKELAKGDAPKLIPR